MCGIAGIISENKREAILRMNKVLTHRGPDEEGYYHDGIVSLGQRRLSIIDLANGTQPISNETETLYLICNGEIYNSPELRGALIRSGHKFKTATDVEVILHLYEDHGENCVKHVRGMFAFALWDKTGRKLFLARDHMGQKPLFYYHGPNGFAFASEVKGILASGLLEPQVDLDGLWHYMSLRFIPEHHSLFKGVHKIPSATSLLFENNNVKLKKYWELDFCTKLTGGEEEIEEGLNELLLETVKGHLLSDVQVGTFLSGGIDSSLVTAMMATIGGKPFPTFSIGVQEQSFNELPFAEMVVNKYGLKSRPKFVQADLINLIPSMIHHMDEPSDPFGVGVYLVAQVASEEVKVVLGGDGGDENFAGYDRFAGNRMVDYYCLLPKWFRKLIMTRIIERIPESFGYKSLAQKAAWVNEMSFFSGGERYAQSMSILRFTQESKKKLFSESAKSQLQDYDSFAKILNFFDADNAEHLVDKMLYTDLLTRMPDHLLSLVDRMTMAHSLESRSPLIDYRVVEYAASIPAELKLKGTNLKYLLKKVAARYLPKELIYRKKQGFTFPLGIWMRRDLKKFIQRLFSESRFIELGIFDANYIANLLQEHFDGKRDHNYRLWVLLNLEIWYRIFFENMSLDAAEGFIRNLREGD
jgi:asparagine synthase (glutamine-hydrolysing)